MNDFFFLFCLQVRPIFLIYGMEEYVMVDGEKKFCSATLSEYLWIIFMFMAAWTSSFFLVWASIFAYFSELTFWHQRTCLTTILVWKTSHIKRTIFLIITLKIIIEYLYNLLFEIRWITLVTQISVQALISVQGGILSKTK